MRRPVKLLAVDDLNANIHPVSQTRDHVVRIQSPANPQFWSAVRGATAA